MGDLQGRTAVITGAGSGLGAGLAVRLATRRVNVVISDIEAGALQRLEGSLAERGLPVLAVVTDVARYAQVESLASAAVSRFGSVDMVFLNAGVTIRGNAWELSDADWRWVYDVNLFGVVNGVRAFVPGLVAQGHGHVIITASNSALATVAGIAPYVSSKHAVVAVAETLQQDLRVASSRIAVSVALPSGIRSRMYDSSRNRGREYGQRAVSADIVATSKAFLEQYGQDPEVVAETIIEQSLGDRRFYILTDSDDLQMANARMIGLNSGELAQPAAPGVRGR